MNNDNSEKTLEELLEPGSTLMVSTQESPGALEFRPLTVAGVSGTRVEILLDTNEEWVHAFRDGDRVHVTMEDTRKNTWLTMRGTGSTTTDPARIDELWNPFASAYFERGRETPSIAVLTIDGDDGRFWSAPSGRIGSVISMLKAKLGSPETSGEHGNIIL